MKPLLEVRDLTTQYTTRAGVVRAVDGVSFSLVPGEILGLVGESGSGKSVTGLSVIGLIDPPGRITGGSVRFQEQELVGSSPAALRAIRGRAIAMVFQDPMTALNPVLTIGTQMRLAIAAHARMSARAARAHAVAALAGVGIADPEQRIDLYLHQLSGGMRQRVAIAMALLHRPALIIADEPTTALDVSVQAQILAEMRRIVAELDTALIWISHDLAVVSALSDRIAVMYAGRIVEEGTTAAVLSRPQHPYTCELLDSLPSRSRPGEELAQGGGLTSIRREGTGCAFQARCTRADKDCFAMPALEGAGAHQVRCHHPVWQP